MTVKREMTLDEWCKKLPDIHLANRELKQLREQIATLEARIKELEAAPSQEPDYEEWKAKREQSLRELDQEPVIVPNDCLMPTPSGLIQLRAGTRLYTTPPDAAQIAALVKTNVDYLEKIAKLKAELAAAEKDAARHKTLLRMARNYLNRMYPEVKGELFRRSIIEWLEDFSDTGIGVLPSAAMKLSPGETAQKGGAA